MTTTANSAADTGLPDAMREANQTAQKAEEALDFPTRLLVGLHRLTAAQKREFAAKLQADGHPELQPLAEEVLKMAERQGVAS
jgi:hypothetical protein